MGDPSLRLEPVAPPSTLSATANQGGVSLSWSASPDNVLGYHVYRAGSISGPFTRLTQSLLPATAFTDPTPSPGNPTYMVRAVVLQTNPSGSYFNPSQGIFASVSTGSGAAPILVLAGILPTGMQLSWNTQPGMTYRVLATSDLAATNWSDLSGTITVTDTTSSWIDTNTGSTPQRFYRITSP